MRKILAILLSGIMCFSLAACSAQNEKTTESDIVIDFDNFEEMNKDETILNDVELTTPKENEEESLTQNEEETVATPQFEEYFEVGEDLLFKDDKFEMAMYNKDVLDFDTGYKRSINGVSNSVINFSSDYLNFVGTSWPSTKEPMTGFKILSYEEALTFEDNYSDIISCVSNDWIEEKFSEDKIYLLVNSTTFDRLFSAFPTAEYDAENNIAYLIFEKEHEHWYVESWIDGTEKEIDEKSKSTSTLIILDKKEVEKLDKIYIMTPEQFVEDENNVEVAWMVTNEDELIDEDDSKISYMLFDSFVDFPEGFLEVSTDEAREFINTYLDRGNEAQINIEMFIYGKKLFIINDDDLTGANTLTTDLRALDYADKLYVELYSDVEATNKGTKCAIVALDPELVEMYEEISFVIDDN